MLLFLAAEPPKTTTYSSVPGRSPGFVTGLFLGAAQPRPETGHGILATVLHTERYAMEQPATFDASRLIRPDLADLEAYTPIVPFEVLAEQLGLPIERIVKLDANENPYGPSPQARAALAAAQPYHIYPDPTIPGCGLL
jgi:hypothetical protein